MAAVGSMFDLGAILQVWKLSRKDSIPMFVTFFLSCYDFRIGIVAGIALHIGMLLYVQNSPKIDISEKNGHFTVQLEHGIAFPVCEVCRNFLLTSLIANCIFFLIL